MIANALLFTVVLLLGYGFWLLDQLKFMARYKAVLFHAYATQSKRPKESVLLRPRELSGENSPHYIYSVLKKENVSLGFKDCATFFE